MERDQIKKVIADQREYQLPADYFYRTQSDALNNYTDDPSVVILSGIRRTGKSTILRNLQKKLPQSDYFFNFDDERLVQFTVGDFQMLYEIFIELYGRQSLFYFDEIQNVEGWERFVRRLYDQGNKVFITGSNAKLLSKELGTHLTGRNVEIEVFPLSFKEIVFHEMPALLEKDNYSTLDVGSLLHLFASYMTYGGIPEFYKHRKEEYLKSLFEGIVYRDIISRHRIDHEKPLKELVYYFASNIGKEFSYSKLSEYLGLGSPHTVSKYCGYLEDCYLSFCLSRYSHSLSKQILYNKKCYMIDTGLIRLIGFRTSEDRGRILENVVFLHLRMQSKEIFFHKEKKECDFILREGNRIVKAVQVAMSLKNPDVRKRELEGLIEAMRAYGLSEGVILTENEEESLKVDAGTVRVIPVWKWLLH